MLHQFKANQKISGFFLQRLKKVKNKLQTLTRQTKKNMNTQNRPMLYLALSIPDSVVVSHTGVSLNSRPQSSNGRRAAEKVLLSPLQRKTESVWTPVQPLTRLPSVSLSSKSTGAEQIHNKTCNHHTTLHVSAGLHQPVISTTDTGGAVQQLSKLINISLSIIKHTDTLTYWEDLSHTINLALINHLF